MLSVIAIHNLIESCCIMFMDGIHKGSVQKVWVYHEGEGGSAKYHPLVDFFKIPLYFASWGGRGVSQKAKMIYSYFLDAPRLKVFLLGMKMINPWKLPGSHKGIYFCADNAQRFLLIRKTSECSRVFSVAINAMGKLSTFTYGFYPSRERERKCVLPLWLRVKNTCGSYPYPQIISIELMYDYGPSYWFFVSIFPVGRLGVWII